jgi:FkbM family methyltransferase
MSYSQGAEEAAILEAVASLPHGLVLDIGAAHPTTFSNSRALIERGWDAILVEASPDQFLSLFREYKDYERVRLVLAVASLGEDFLERLYHTEDLVSTTERANYEKWRNHAAFDGEFWVATVPIYALFELAVPRVDVLSIDTEGTSGELFRYVLEHIVEDISADAWPKVICVEHDGDGTLETLAVRKGYTRRYLDGNNLIVAR